MAERVWTEADLKLPPLSPRDPCGLLFLLQGGEGKGSFRTSS